MHARASACAQVVVADQNNVHGRAQLERDSGAVKRLGTQESTAACQAAAAAAGHAGFAYYLPAYKPATFASRCFGVVPVAFTWAPTPEPGVVSGHLDQQNTWVADVSAARLSEMLGLRRNGKRAVRAKFPNGDPQSSGDWLSGASASMGGGEYERGWLPEDGTSWVPPFRQPDAEEIVVSPTDWPGVEWPVYEGAQDGQGDTNPSPSPNPSPNPNPNPNPNH